MRLDLAIPIAFYDNPPPSKLGCLIGSHSLHFRNLLWFFMEFASKILNSKRKKKWGYSF